MVNDNLVSLQEILSNNKLFYQFLTDWGNHYLKETYEDYRKFSYNDPKNKRDPKFNITAHIKISLEFRLKDFFKRKEFNIDKKRKEGEDIEKIPLRSKNQVINLKANKIRILMDKQHFFTVREKEVLEFIMQGYKQVDIAIKLKITKGRISQIMKDIKQKIKKFFETHPAEII